MTEITVRLWCAVPTPEKFIMQLLYVRPALNKTCLFMSRLVRSAFFGGGKSILANIWQERGHHLPTSVGVRKLEWVPFCVVSKYLQCII